MEIRLSKYLINIMILSSFISGIYLSGKSFGISHIRMSEILVIISIVILFSSIIFNVYDSIDFNLNGFGKYILIYCLINLISTISNFGVGFHAVKVFVNIFLFYLIYILTLNMVNYNNTKYKYSVIESYAKYGLVFSIIGLIGWFLSVVTNKGITIGVDFNHFKNYYGSIKSLSYEPNLFAVITLTVLIYYILIYFYYNNDLKRHIIILLLILAIIFSYTRTIYITLLLSLIFIMFYRVNNNQMIRFDKKRELILVIIIIGLASLLSFHHNTIEERLLNIVNFEKGSGLGRLFAFQIGLKGFIKKPIIGNGTMSADTRLVLSNGTLSKPLGGKGWLFSSIIQSLHDTGLIGLADMLILLIYPIKKWWEILNRTNSKNVKMFSYFFVISNFVIAISAQISSSLWIAFPWVFWGITFGYYESYHTKMIKHKIIIKKAL